MKMRNVLSNQKSGQSVPALTVGVICRNDTDDLSAVRLMSKDDRPSADSIDGNTVNQVSAPVLPSCANAAGEKTKGVRFDAGITNPPNLDSDFDGDVHWQEWYRLLWEIKLVWCTTNHSGICYEVGKNNSNRLFEKRSFL